MASFSCVSSDATKRMLSGTLNQCCLCIQDLKRLLQPCNFCGSARCALFVCLGLGDTPGLEAFVVFLDGVELCLCGSSIGSFLCNLLVKTFELLGLVFHTLIFCGFCDIILLGLRIVVLR